MRISLRSLIGVIVLLSASSALQVQELPDFSGTWTLDASRSSPTGTGDGRGRGVGRGDGGGLGLGPSPDTLVIQQTSTLLTIQEHRGTTAATVRYRLDGQSASNRVTAGRSEGTPTSAISAWTGQRLRTTVTLQSATRNAQYEEVRYLDGGRRLVVETVIAGQPMSRIAVYAQAPATTR